MNALSVLGAAGPGYMFNELLGLLYGHLHSVAETDGVEEKVLPELR